MIQSPEQLKIKLLAERNTRTARQKKENITKGGARIVRASI